MANAILTEEIIGNFEHSETGCAFSFIKADETDCPEYWTQKRKQFWLRHFPHIILFDGTTTRDGNVSYGEGTVKVVVDEDESGRPVVESWPIQPVGWPQRYVELKQKMNHTLNK